MYGLPNRRFAKPAGKYPKLRPVRATNLSYQCTVQTWGKYRDVRGNPPGNLGEKEWLDQYNKLDDRLRKGKKWSTARARRERDSGGVRKAAIRDLMEHNRLPHYFQDSNP